MKKSIITLCSYDAHMLPNSIKTYYNFVDEIVIGLDKDRITWSGNKFTFDEDKLWKDLQSIDHDKKIEVIEENFHRSKVPIENDNFERNYLKAHCSNEWIFSFDADEELINPTEFFINYLPFVERYYENVDLMFSWILPYKKLPTDKKGDDYYLVIANNNDTLFMGDVQGFATCKYNTYNFCRWTDNKRKLLTPLAVLHWSFCRKEEEINMKINNFGHSDKTPNDPFFNNWKLIDENNYTQLRNFKTHGMGGPQWEKLAKVKESEFKQLCKVACRNII